MTAAAVPGDYAERVARARAAMAGANVDVLLVDHAEALAWLTGYTVSEAKPEAALQGDVTGDRGRQHDASPGQD